MLTVNLAVTVRWKKASPYLRGGGGREGVIWQEKKRMLKRWKFKARIDFKGGQRDLGLRRTSSPYLKLGSNGKGHMICLRNAKAHNWKLD